MAFDYDYEDARRHVIVEHHWDPRFWVLGLSWQTYRVADLQSTREILVPRWTREVRLYVLGLLIRVVWIRKE